MWGSDVTEAEEEATRRYPPSLAPVVSDPPKDEHPLPATIAEIRARLAKITPGPWWVNEKPVTVAVMDMKRHYITENVRSHPNQLADAEFIAHAPTDIQFLLDALDLALGSQGKEAPKP
jgi:hypothetical protein